MSFTNELLGDPEVCIRENKNLVHMVCQKMRRTLSKVRIEYDDAFQEGCMALYKAYMNYDGRGKFSTVAVKYITNHVLRLIYLADMQKRKAARKAISLETVVHNEDGHPVTLESLLASDEKDQTAEYVLEFCDTLRPAEQTVLIAILQGYKHQEIAKLIGCGRQNVSRIVSVITEKYADYENRPIPIKRQPSKKQKAAS